MVFGKQAFLIFSLSSGLGLSSGVGQLISVGKKGPKTLSSEEVGRMHQYGTGNTGVCLGYSLKDGEIARKADIEGEKVKLVFWFQENGKGDCGGLLKEQEKEEKVKKYMEDNGYWRLTITKNSLNGNLINEQLKGTLRALKKHDLISSSSFSSGREVWNCLLGGNVGSDVSVKKVLCDVIKTLVVKQVGEGGRGEWIWVKGTED